MAEHRKAKAFTPREAPHEYMRWRKEDAHRGVWVHANGAAYAEMDDELPDLLHALREEPEELVQLLREQLDDLVRLVGVEELLSPRNEELKGGALKSAVMKRAKACVHLPDGAEAAT